MADREWASQQPEEALRKAAEAGDAATVHKLIAGRPALLDEKDKHGRTALIWAAHNGHLQIAEALVDAGADLDLQDSYGFTALYCAAYSNKPAVVRLLVGRGADQTIKGSRGETAREHAARNGSAECADLLR